ncbi:MAG: hypothetical protein HYW25_05805 [Candidatus Aenigmarchaeota archaeon]|nr:hypothetical protein [Candidatus Aenigmarchaeota archaeon]
MDLEECFEKGIIKRAIVNEGLIKSLVEMSRIEETTIRIAVINETTISPYVSMAYDSLREILEAICLFHGYKVLSHMCIGELARKLLVDFDYHEFDRFRYIRNGINYYGKKVELSQGSEIIKKIFEMKNHLTKKHLDKFL